MTTADDGTTQRFNPEFPVFASCREVSGRGTEVLRIKGRFAGDDFDSVSTPIFSSEERCLSFGSGHGYDNYFRFRDPKFLLHFLRQLASNGVDYVQFDPSLAGPTQGVFPIESAIQFLLYRTQKEDAE